MFYFYFYVFSFALVIYLHCNFVYTGNDVFFWFFFFLCKTAPYNNVGSSVGRHLQQTIHQFPISRPFKFGMKWNNPRSVRRQLPLPATEPLCRYTILVIRWNIKLILYPRVDQHNILCSMYLYTVRSDDCDIDGQRDFYFRLVLSYSGTNIICLLFPVNIGNFTSEVLEIKWVLAVKAHN